MDILLQVLLTYREYQVDPQQYLFFDERTFITVVTAAATLFYLGRCMEAVLTSEWFWKVVGFLADALLAFICFLIFPGQLLWNLWKLVRKDESDDRCVFYECLIFLTGAAVTAVLKKIPYIKSFYRQFSVKLCLPFC